MKCPKCHANLEPKQFWPIETADVQEDLFGFSLQEAEDLLKIGRAHV